MNRLYPPSYDSESESDEDEEEEEEEEDKSHDDELKEVIVTDDRRSTAEDVPSISNMLNVRRSSHGSTSTRETVPAKGTTISSKNLTNFL